MYYALIAGGSTGIGYSIAKAFAKRKIQSGLSGKTCRGINRSKKMFEEKYDIKVYTLKIDLSEATAADEIMKWCTEKELPLKALCNIAGLGGKKDFLKLPLEDLRYMVRLNIESVMALSLQLLPLLEKNSPSYILNVGSMAGFAPIPEKNLYASTKAAVIAFSYSLRYQLKLKNKRKLFMPGSCIYQA